MADNTEIAGVIIPSPKNRDAPIKPSAIRKIFLSSAMRVVRRFNANNDMIPPSPLLSARIIMVTYLKLMVSIMHQKIRDKIPNTLAWVIARCAVKKVCLKAYRGLVPISPNTTPSAAKVMTGKAAFFAVLCIGVFDLDGIFENHSTTLKIFL